MMQQHFTTFAHYNRWANRRLYAAAAALPDTDYRADKGAFFGSLHGTLNHILVADRIWLKRITGEGDPPNRLDTILHEDLATLTEAREAEDERIIAVVAGTDEAALRRALSYKTTSGAPSAQPLAQVLAHFFNHQTHHRGQAHGILSSLGKDPPPLDLLYFLRETA